MSCSFFDSSCYGPFLTGIQGIIFDKDNTLTAPYVDHVHDDVKSALEKSKEVFGDRICILSNSAGTADDRG